MENQRIVISPASPVTANENTIGFQTLNTLPVFELKTRHLKLHHLQFYLVSFVSYPFY
ncbi:unnamed protein product, partial [Vitis vinifera]